MIQEPTPVKPQVLLVWVPKSATRNLEFGVKHGVWGFPREFDAFNSVRSGDWLVLASGENDDGSRPRQHGWPRVQFEEWVEHKTPLLYLGRVTGQRRDDPVPLWPDETRTGEVKYPYRFDFSVVDTFHDVSFDPADGQLGAAVSDNLRNAAMFSKPQLTHIASGSIFPDTAANSRKPHVWWVNQGATYVQERQGGYLWAPIVTKAGHSVEHHLNVARLVRGDVVVHYANSAIRAISRVTGEPRTQARPAELPAEAWESEGNYAELKYFELSNPITINELPSRPPDAGPFAVDGAVKQVYLVPLDPRFADQLRAEFTTRWPAGSPWEALDAQRFWLFQANPEKWAIDDFLARAQPGDLETWLANQSRAAMKPGDQVVLWKAGPQAGAYAFTELIGDAFERPRSEWNSGDEPTEWAVPMRVTHVFSEPILRSSLVEHPILKDLAVIKFANATNFAVTPEQWEALMALTETSIPVHPPAADPMDWLEQTTLWPRSDLEELLRSLNDETPQAILAGPPGTGKTWVALQVARYLTGETSDAPAQFVRTVQFHPTFGYEEFVEGLRPAIGESGMITFERMNGVVLDIAETIRRDGRPRVLVIDEMNRANLPRVFGELMFLTEYRDTPIKLLYSEEFSLPRSLYLIGTMNTADRSIRSVDVALRRRFDFFETPPSSSILRRYYERDTNHNALGDELYIGFEILNSELTKELDRHHTIGHTFFMQPQYTAETLGRVWNHQLLPLIEEYFFDQPDIAASFSLGKYWPSA